MRLHTANRKRLRAWRRKQKAEWLIRVTPRVCAPAVAALDVINRIMNDMPVLIALWNGEMQKMAQNIGMVAEEIRKRREAEQIRLQREIDIHANDVPP